LFLLLPLLLIARPLVRQTAAPTPTVRVRILFLNGRNGKPVPNTTVNVSSTLYHTDANGYIEANVNPDAQIVANPWGSFARSCNPDGAPAHHDVRTIITTSISESNACGKPNMQAHPGELIVTYRKETFVEWLKSFKDFG
jgi:hypothetical protein